MRIRALIHIAGAGFSLSPGDVTERFPPDEALRLVASRAAVLADPIPDMEMAVIENLKTETRKRGRKK